MSEDTLRQHYRNIHENVALRRETLADYLSNRPSLFEFSAPESEDRLQGVRIDSRWSVPRSSVDNAVVFVEQTLHLNGRTWKGEVIAPAWEGVFARVGELGNLRDLQEYRTFLVESAAHVNAELKRISDAIPVNTPTGDEGLERVRFGAMVNAISIHLGIYGNDAFDNKTVEPVIADDLRTMTAVRFKSAFFCVNALDVHAALGESDLENPFRDVGFSELR